MPDYGWFIVLLVAAAAVAVWIWRGQIRKKVLPAGWQFTDRPTTLDVPGTVFRLDRDGVRHGVTTIRDVQILRGLEEDFRRQLKANASVGVVAQFIGVSLSVAAKKIESFVFELAGITHEYTEDKDVDSRVGPALADISIRPHERYFIVREALQATGMTYLLSEQQVADFGGTAEIQRLTAKGDLVKIEQSGQTELQKTFTQSMRVMFLAEELTMNPPVTAQTAAPVRGADVRISKDDVKSPVLWTTTVEAMDSEIDALRVADSLYRA